MSYTLPPAVAHLKAGLDRYANERIATGGFLASVLRNDLAEAVTRADGTSLAYLREIVWYVHNEMPADCHGSPERVAAWLAEWGKE